MYVFIFKYSLKMFKFAKKKSKIIIIIDYDAIISLFLPSTLKTGFSNENPSLFYKACMSIYMKKIFIYIILSIGELGKHLYHIDEILSYL
jgi:hypothetical protein